MNSLTPGPASREGAADGLDGAAGTGALRPQCVTGQLADSSSTVMNPYRPSSRQLEQASLHGIEGSDGGGLGGRGRGELLELVVEAVHHLRRRYKVAAMKLLELFVETVCVCVCVRACVRACVCVSVSVSVCV